MHIRHPCNPPSANPMGLKTQHMNSNALLSKSEEQAAMLEGIK